MGLVLASLGFVNYTTIWSLSPEEFHQHHSNGRYTWNNIKALQCLLVAQSSPARFETTEMVSYQDLLDAQEELTNLKRESCLLIERHLAADKRRFLTDSLGDNFCFVPLGSFMLRWIAHNIWFYFVSIPEDKFQVMFEHFHMLGPTRRGYFVTHRIVASTIDAISILVRDRKQEIDGISPKKTAPAA